MEKKKIKKISFIIPIFNEDKRLKNLFKKINSFSIRYKEIDSEFIFVNDGSTDNSKKILKKYIIQNKKKFKLINYNKNKGKGFALKKGVLFSKNDWLLTIDADLSVNLEQIIKWNNKFMFSSDNAYWGSRGLKTSKIKTKILRKIMGVILCFILKVFYNFKIKDTQCGFKLYHKSYAKKLFKKLDIYDFSHDIKLLILLKKLSINVTELPLVWRHMNGSKVNILKDSFIFLKRIIFEF